MKKLLIVLAVCTLAAATTVSAGQLAKGDTELTFTLSWDNVEGDVSGIEEETTDFSILFGYMLTDGNEIGGMLSYTKLDVTGTPSVDGNAIGAFYHYNFRAGGNVNPYVGVEYSVFGGDLGDFVDSEYGAVVGVKIYPWDNAGMNFGFRYAEWQGADNFEDATQTQVFGGISIKW